ncbi:hypothetical protein [Thiocystis minor]|uniref:hypothetical protein n=1 Tax=Thiocystis minor TaxID=61597 RepID=UPI001911912C|nr:hypothetical protein [Thiocystis minor]
MSSRQARSIAPGQTFVVDRFQPGDAEGLVDLVRAVYGPDYPIDLYYDPERLRAENASGRLYSVVARAPSGDILAHGALYRSSPPFAGLLEVGQYLVLPAYRESFAAFQINQFIAGPLLDQVRPAAIFGEAVCHHLATQKVTRLIGCRDFALEAGLMPASTYEREGSGAQRGSCLLAVRCDQDRARVLHLPEDLRPFIARLLDGAGLERQLLLAHARVPVGAVSELRVEHFPHAQVSRAALLGTGADIEVRLGEWLADCAARGTRVEQIFVNLAEPWVERALGPLGELGFFCCGLAPRWLDEDALLLERLHEPLDFEAIQVYSAEAKFLRDQVHEQWLRLTPLAADDG